MWEAEFYPELLSERNKIVINCLTEEAERKAASILAEHGILYPDSKSPVDVPNWNHYRDRFCYFVDHGVVRRGTREAGKNREEDWFKCTFPEAESPDFDTATDAELKQLFGI